MDLLETFHHGLAAKLGDGTFDLTREVYRGRFGDSVIEVPLADIVMANDVGAVPLLVEAAAKRAKP